MKAYKVELLIVDFDEVGPEFITVHIENAHYPNRCMAPHVMRIRGQEIGEWTDEHPLNKYTTMHQAYNELFNESAH